MNSNYNRNLTDTYYDTEHEDLINNSTDGNKKSIMTEFFYYNKHHSVNYHLGLRGMYNHTVNDYKGSKRNTIDQQSMYPYASIESTLKNVSYSLGTGLQILHSDDQALSKTYYRNLTTLTLFYNKKSTWNVKNVTRYTPSFPALSYLNDIDQRQDTLMIVRGNPLLKPSQTISNNFILNYQIKDKIRSTLNLNASKIFDPIRNSYFYDSDLASFVMQRNNQKYESNIGAQLDLSFLSILNLFNFSTGITWDQYQSKGEDYFHKLTNVYWYIFCNTQVKNFSFDVGYRKPSRDLAGQSIYLNENYSSFQAAYRKNNLLPKDTVYVYTNDLKYLRLHNSELVMNTASQCDSLTVVLESAFGKLNVNSNFLNIIASAGSRLSAIGSTKFLDCVVGAGSHVNAKNLKAKQTGVNVMGYSTLLINSEEVTSTEVKDSFYTNDNNKSNKQ